MKASELRQKSAEELNATLVELGREQFNLRMQRATNQLSDNSQMKKVRRNIARVKTIMNEKQSTAS